jgi:hypothetical protein
MSDTKIPLGPHGVRLNGRGAIAAYWLGADTKRNRRRVTALMHEVKEAARIPFGVDGNGMPFSYSHWLDMHARALAQYLPAELAVPAE